MDAPQQQRPVAELGPIDVTDTADWIRRFNDVFTDISQISAPGLTNHRPWISSFCGCCCPIDLCCITYWLPCITFGKTHHRTRKNGNMDGYEPINTSCLLLCGSAWIGLHWIPMALQSADIRKKYGLQGSCFGDIAKACCCAPCTLVQAEKETKIREAEIRDVDGQYSRAETMSYIPMA
ncbi:putative mannose-1-phosphate guanyltransferase [Venturia inaequalis]|nr:putative mannose-1-phosphate guanyltransferase [Venturia inaequalis]